MTAVYTNSGFFLIDFLELYVLTFCNNLEIDKQYNVKLKIFLNVRKTNYFLLNKY